MPIRLIKASINLNVGINTLVEFLQKHGSNIEANPNTKIEDSQYDLLIAEFGKDKNIKQEVEQSREKLHQQKEERRETVAIEGYELPESQNKKQDKSSIKTEVPKEMKPKFNVVGSIDLDSLNKKKAVKKEPELIEEKKEQPAVEPIKEEQPIIDQVVEIVEPVKIEKTVHETVAREEKIHETVAHEEKIHEVVVHEEKVQEEKVHEKKVHEETIMEVKKPVAEKQNPVKQEEKPQPKIVESKEETMEVKGTQEKTQENKVFRIHKEKLESNIVVKGTIDLDSINDKTRPPRKSKAQRKQERLEREQKELDSKRLKEEKVKLLKKETIEEQKKARKPNSNESEADDASKKKRTRIRKGKVNLDKPATFNNATRGTKKVLKKPIKAAVSDEDVQKQIKETLARLTEKRGGKGGAKYRREKRDAVAEKQQQEIKQREKESKILQLTEFVTANDLANMMNVPITNVIATSMSLGVMVAINQRMDAETINIVAEEYGFKTQFVSAEVVEAITVEEDKPEDLISRPPIVTVMGHVDHGKTSLLDSIRNANVIAGEAGGITQHIGAYNVKLEDGRQITFLDTPGHEAFTAMRARGAKVTDVVIIIIAADDNVMPQTVEAISHASAAGVPMVFAINKIDKPGANTEKIKEELAKMNYLVEDWGGKYQSQEISAKKGIGIKELLEKVLLEADMLELKANPKKRASGSIIESSLDKGRGYVATVLVENGTLKQGDIVIAGASFGKIKAMFNERNQRIDEAKPSEPALILGLNGAPQAGDTFNVLDNEQEARSIASRREQLQREQSLRTQKMLTLDDIGRRIAIGNFQELNLIVKGDVDGSVEALSDSLIQLSTPEIQVNVIHKAVGQISESDITLASASNAIIIGFQVRPSLQARREAEKQGVDIRLYSIIYDAIEEVTAAMEGMLSPEIKEEIKANVEVLDVFKVSKVGTVAGCMVRDGKIKRTSKIRLIREGIVIFTGELESLKRFKDDIKEVSVGYECGITIHNFNDIKIGDIIEAFEEIEVKKSL
ncbi:MAG: translation initiation factor IF-2 [Dysgonamonadaceae bacterium]|nr:translation initiation factor IF-2 [Dysgonamonadaceae bacterium]MDD3901197.1 translation initiation factor IF-2 [Dysgonamonadaceae bacterium]MDD4398963.1 translation initiation factor IF-2 [Dysgonamonadaceae bacterium]